MKKTLMGTSAGALIALAAAPAGAVEWEINLGGYMEQHIGYANFDEQVPANDFDGFDIKSDQEFYFRPSLTLENGITFQARMDFEGQAAGGVDEPHLRINGSFGSIRIGEDDLASADVIIAAPDVTFLGINSGSNTLFEPGGGLFGANAEAGLRSTFLAVDGDPVGITYFTPRFAGFQIGVSYAPEGDGDDSDNDDQPNRSAQGEYDIFAIGANYSNSFGPVSIDAGIGYSYGNDVGGPVGDPSTIAAGAAIGYDLGGSTITIGGSWGEGNNSADGTGANDGMTYELGISYETGPWGFSFTYLHSEEYGGDGDEIDDFMLGINYELAEGVQIAGFAIYSQQDEGTANVADQDGFIIGTGIRLDF